VKKCISVRLYCRYVLLLPHIQTKLSEPLTHVPKISRPPSTDRFHLRGSHQIWLSSARDANFFHHLHPQPVSDISHVAARMVFCTFPPNNLNFNRIHRLLAQRLRYGAFHSFARATCAPSRLPSEHGRW
jgi:hypothetical protein